MKYLAILGMLLIPLQVSAAPYQRPLDIDNPYSPPMRYFREGYDYDPNYIKARLLVAEVCQDLKFSLRKHPNPELSMLIDQCNPDEMEWYAIGTCQQNEIAMAVCPVAELLLLDVSVLRAYLNK
jgi:hypothetical protein